MKSYDIVIVGGGPAGLAAAASAKEHGIDSILILERDKELGGILNQCIHNGFGLHTFKEELTGPEYAGRFIEKVEELGITYELNTMVMDISKDKVVTAMNRGNVCGGGRSHRSGHGMQRASERGTEYSGVSSGWNFFCRNGAKTS